jgi:hypothetical protein
MATLVEALNDVASKMDGNSPEWLIVTNAADQLAAVPAIKEALQKAEIELESLRELRDSLQVVVSHAVKK